MNTLILIIVLEQRLKSMVLNLDLSAYMQICENGIISVGSSSLDVSSSDNISPCPITGSEARLIAPLWSDVDIVETVNGEIVYQIFTEDYDSDQLELVSRFISHQYRSNVTFTGRWMIVVEWNRVLPHSRPPGSNLRVSYTALIQHKNVSVYA